MRPSGRIMGLILTACLMGCSKPPPKPDPKVKAARKAAAELAHLVKNGKDGAAYQLRDRSSAQFRNLRMDDHYMCGEINGKNGFGAYEGFTPFVSNVRDHDDLYNGRGDVPLSMKDRAMIAPGHSITEAEALECLRIVKTKPVDFHALARLRCNRIADDPEYNFWDSYRIVCTKLMKPVQ